MHQIMRKTKILTIELQKEELNINALILEEGTVDSFNAVRQSESEMLN